MEMAVSSGLSDLESRDQGLSLSVPNIDIGERTWKLRDPAYSPVDGAVKKE